jgi:hypothetical protein
MNSSAFKKMVTTETAGLSLNAPLRSAFQRTVSAPPSEHGPKMPQAVQRSCGSLYSPEESVPDRVTIAPLLSVKSLPKGPIRHASITQIPFEPIQEYRPRGKVLAGLDRSCTGGILMLAIPVPACIRHEYR